MPSARCAEIKSTKPRSSAFVQDRLRSYEHTEEMGDDKEIDTERKEDDGENENNQTEKNDSKKKDTKNEKVVSDDEIENNSKLKI